MYRCLPVVIACTMRCKYPTPCSRLLGQVGGGSAEHNWYIHIHMHIHAPRTPSTILGFKKQAFAKNALLVNTRPLAHDMFDPKRRLWVVVMPNKIAVHQWENSWGYRDPTRFSCRCRVFLRGVKDEYVWTTSTWHAPNRVFILV